MSYTIAEVLNNSQHVRTYQDQYGTKFVFNVTLSDGSQAQVSKQLATTPPQVGEVYNTLKPPPDNAPEGALPTLRDKEYEGGSGAPQSGSQGRRESSDWDPYHPKQKLIIRQSAIKAAVEINEGMVAGMDDGRVQEKLDEWITYFENKTWEVLGEDEPAGPANIPVNPTVGPVGEITNVDVLKAKQLHGVDPETFSMVVTSVGAESLQAATQKQRGEIIEALEELA